MEVTQAGRQTDNGGKRRCGLVVLSLCLEVAFYFCGTAVALAGLMRIAALFDTAKSFVFLADSGAVAESTPL